MSQKITWVKKLIDDFNFSDWKTLFLSDTTKYGDNGFQVIQTLILSKD
jgi:hypothetical protein